MEQRQIDQSQAQLLMQFAFNQVCDPNDWKKPVEALVPLHLAPLYSRAIEYMTAAEVIAIQKPNDMVLLASFGYRCRPAGDF